jgi:heme A synthase
VGYAFYAGYPSAIIAGFLFLLCLVWAWRSRRATIYGPAIFGSVLAATVTAVTNVALETPYIAGPTWAALAAAVALGTLSTAKVPTVVLQPNSSTSGRLAKGVATKSRVPQI